MWKIFVIIAAVLLLGAAFLSYQNMESYKGEVVARQRAESDLGKSRDLLAKAQAELKSTEASVVQVEQEKEKIGAEVATVEVAISEEQKKETALNEKLEKMINDVAAMQDLEDQLGEISKIETEMATRQQDLQDLDQNILATQNAIAIANARRESIQRQVENYVALERDQASGVIRARRSASVSNVFQPWGFVVVDAGDRQGYVPQGELVVQRDGAPICRLRITNVEPNRSVADIVPGTLAEGEQLVPGDIVIPIRRNLPSES